MIAEGIPVSGDLHASGIGGRLSLMEPNEIITEIRATRRALAAERDPRCPKETE